MNPFKVKCVSSPVPSFLIQKDIKKKLEGRVYCCLACSGKFYGIDEELIDHIIIHYDSAYAALKEFENLMTDYKDLLLPALIPANEKQVKVEKAAKIIFSLLRNMDDIHGEKVISLRHRHYYVHDEVYFHCFDYRCELFDDYLRRGQVMLLYTNSLFATAVSTEVRTVVDSLKVRRMDDHLYLGLYGIPTEKVIMISFRPGNRSDITCVPGSNGIHMYFNGLQESGTSSSRKQYVLTVESENILENELLNWKMSFQEEITLLILHYIPHLEYGAAKNILPPRGATWLKLMRKVFGDIQDLMIIIAVNVDDFPLIQNKRQSVTSIDHAVSDDLNVGTKLKIFSVDATAPHKDDWQIIRTQTTF